MLFKMMSKVEINFTRLLAQCEIMASEKKHGEWRLEKYVCALERRLTEMKKSIHLPAQEKLNEYKKKVDFFKGLLKTEKMDSALDKAQCSQLLASSTTPTLPDSKSNVGKTTTKHLHLQATSKYTNEMRKDLLGPDFEEDASKETSITGVSGSEDLDAVLKHHRNKQEMLAENMVSLVRRMKHTTAAAGNIIKKDNERLVGTIKQADKNLSELDTESKRLEVHAKKSCNWWIWGSLGMVFIVFLWMIMFIRLFSKQ